MLSFGVGMMESRQKYSSRYHLSSNQPTPPGHRSREIWFYVERTPARESFSVNYTSIKERETVKNSY